MINFPSRCGAVALVLTAGFGLARTTHAQIAPATDTAHTDAQGRHIAPHDTFYTLDYVSARTDKGVEEYPPGTGVHLVSVDHEAHTLTVTDGHANVVLPPEKLTNDMDIAAMVKAKDDANQTLIVAYQQKQAAAYQKYLKEVDAYTAKDLEKREKFIREEDARANATTGVAPQTTQPANANANSSGYYNEGGEGYGDPYGYIINVNPSALRSTNGTTTNTTGQGGGNSGTISSQNAGQSNGAARNGGTTSGGSAGGAGGKKN